MRAIEEIRLDLEHLYEHLEEGGDGGIFDICGLSKEAAEALAELQLLRALVSEEG